jgi:hypothetical protein
MNWDQQSTYPFNRTSVLRITSEVSGVYGLLNGNGWIYIGECPNLQRALLECLSGQRPCILQFQPTVFVFELCPPKNRKPRQKALVQIYRPASNKKSLPARAVGWSVTLTS